MVAPSMGASQDGVGDHGANGPGSRAQSLAGLELRSVGNRDAQVQGTVQEGGIDRGAVVGGIAEQDGVVAVDERDAPPLGPHGSAAARLGVEREVDVERAVHGLVGGGEQPAVMRQPRRRVRCACHVRYGRQQAEECQRKSSHHRVTSGENRREIRLSAEPTGNPPPVEYAGRGTAPDSRRTRTVRIHYRPSIRTEITGERDPVVTVRTIPPEWRPRSRRRGYVDEKHRQRAEAGSHDVRMQRAWRPVDGKGSERRGDARTQRREDARTRRSGWMAERRTGRAFGESVPGVGAR